MVGGLVSSFALELLVYPALFAFWKGRGLSPQTMKEIL
jgi:Cu/Ag efflux pump CusA